MIRYLTVITMLLLICSCDLIKSEKTKNDEQNLETPVENTGMRSVVDDETWIDYLTGSVWVIQNDNIDLSSLIAPMELFYFEEDQTQIYYIDNFLTALVWGAVGEDSFKSEFKIEDSILYIESEYDGSFVKYALLECGNETIYSREMNLKFYTNGELNGIEQSYTYNIMPPVEDPEVLSDVIQGELYSQLNNTSWTSGPYSCEVLRTKSSNLFNKSEFIDWYSTKYNEDSISYIYEETKPRAVVSSDEYFAYLLIDNDLGMDVDITIDLDDPDSIFYTDSSINEELGFQLLENGSYEVIYYTDKTIVYSDEYLDIIESNYYINIEFIESNHEIQISAFKEDIEVLNYTKSFYIMDNIMLDSSLFGLRPIYTIDLDGNNLNLTNFSSMQIDDNEFLELNFTQN